MAASIRDLVTKLFDVWPGYQLGLRHSVSTETREKDLWLKDLIATELEKSEPNGETQETLVEWLEEILNEDFDVILEDDSIVAFVRQFVEAAALVRGSGTPEGLQKLNAFVSKLPAKCTLNAKSAGGDDSSGDDYSDAEMDTDEPPVPPKKETQPPPGPDADGFTVVRRR